MRPPQADLDDVRAVQERLGRLPGPGGYQAAEAARAVYDQAEELWRLFPQDAEARRSHVEARDRYDEALRRAFAPTFSQSMDRLRAGDPAGLEDAIAFLEADPIFYGTGYLKEELSRLLRRLEIPTSYVTRLQSVVLSIVDRRDDRDFRAFCRLARKVDSPELRAQLERRLTRALPSGEALTDDQPSLLEEMRRDRAIRRRTRWVLEALEQGEKHAPTLNEGGEGINPSR